MRGHINRFFSLKCGPDILPFFQNSHPERVSKELTESFAMWRAAADVLKLDNQETIIAIVVGDGVRPRTASLLAHVTQWNCFSIDPQMDMAWFNQYAQERVQLNVPLQRLHPFAMKAADLKIDCNGFRALVVMPHSHALVEESLKVPFNYSRLDAISMPCCKQVEPKYLSKDFVMKHDVKTYVDEHVWSPKNTIHVWQNL